MTKHFYFTQEVKRHSKTYGYNDMYCNIYKIDKKDGTPCSIGICEYRTGSTRGAIHEVFAKLVELKLIPKKYYKLKSLSVISTLKLFNLSIIPLALSSLNT